MHPVKTSCSPDSPEHDIRLEGEIDLACEAQLLDALQQFEACDHRDVCIDASALEFIDSTGLTLLARLCRTTRDRGGSVRVTGAPYQLERLVEMTHLPVDVDPDPRSSCGDEPTEEEPATRQVHPSPDRRPDHVMPRVASRKP